MPVLQLLARGSQDIDAVRITEQVIVLESAGSDQVQGLGRGHCVGSLRFIFKIQARQKVEFRLGAVA
jgi:hypothetical protein